MQGPLAGTRQENFSDASPRHLTAIEVLGSPRGGPFLCFLLVYGSGAPEGVGERYGELIVVRAVAQPRSSACGHNAKTLLLGTDRHACAPQLFTPAPDASAVVATLAAAAKKERRQVEKSAPYHPEHNQDDDAAQYELQHASISVPHQGCHYRAWA